MFICFQSQRADAACLRRATLLLAYFFQRKEATDFAGT